MSNERFCHLKKVVIMLKKSVLGLIVISSLASTQASASLVFCAINGPGGILGCPNPNKDLKGEVASELPGRHVFPVYKTAENKYFVAIRTTNIDLKFYSVDGPNTSKFLNQIWDAFVLAQSAEPQPKHNAEALTEVLNLLDKASLARLVVFGSKDWNKADYSGLAPYSIIDGEYLKSIAEAVPYFDSSAGNLVPASDSFGVGFQALQRRALDLAKRLSSKIENEEARLNADL